MLHCGGLTLAGLQLPTKQLSKTLSRRGGGSMMKNSHVKDRQITHELSSQENRLNVGKNNFTYCQLITEQDSEK